MLDIADPGRYTGRKPGIDLLRGQPRKSEMEHFNTSNRKEQIL